MVKSVKSLTTMNRIFFLHENLEQLIFTLEDTLSLKLFAEIEGGGESDLLQTKTTCGVQVRVTVQKGPDPCR